MWVAILGPEQAMAGAEPGAGDAQPFGILLRRHRLAAAPAPRKRPHGLPRDTGHGPPHNLPAEVSSFVGREQDLERLAASLADARLLTLLGPGGVGKTRLALRLAAGLRGDYPDGVWLVDLAPLTDARLVPSAVVSALRLREAPGGAGRGRAPGRAGRAPPAAGPGQLRAPAGGVCRARDRAAAGRRASSARRWPSSTPPKTGPARPSAWCGWPRSPPASTSRPRPPDCSARPRHSSHAPPAGAPASTVLPGPRWPRRSAPNWASRRSRPPGAGGRQDRTPPSPRPRGERARLLWPLSSSSLKDRLVDDPLAA